MPASNSLSRFRAHVAIAGRRLLDSQDCGRLFIAQHLEVPERQDFPIERTHAIEDLLNADLRLGPDRRPAGRSQASQQLCGERHRRCLRKCAAIKGNLLSGIAHFRAQMLPMQIN